MTALKPPYRVPLMSEVAEIPWNGLTVASTFSGCGGSCLGYRMAGFRVGWANEFLPAAQESYRANAAPGSVLDPRDIKLVQPEDILKALRIKKGELDLFDGLPPCQAFSTAGQREKGWGKQRKYENGSTQQNELLFWEYIRLLRGLMPRAFIAENVAGLVKGTAKGFFLEILRDLKASGYRVEARVLDAQWLGVPQTRARLIFVGVREDLGLAPEFPDPLPYRYTVREALPWVDQVVNDTSGQYSAGDVTDKPSCAILTGSGNHFRVRGATPPPGAIAGDPRPASMRVRGTSGFKRGKDPGVDLEAPAPAVMASGMGGVAPHQIGVRGPLPPSGDGPNIEGTAIGREYPKLVHGEQSGKYFNLVKAHPDRPSPAILASHGGRGVASVVHPNEPRKFLIAELRRICSFPDDFVLKGSFAQQWERMGNSVPPVMMSHVAAKVRDVLLRARKMP